MSKASKPQCAPKFKIVRERVLIRDGYAPIFFDAQSSYCCNTTNVSSAVNHLSKILLLFGIDMRSSCFCCCFCSYGNWPGTAILNFFRDLFYFSKIFLNFFLNFCGWIYMTSSCICGGFSSNGYWPAATIWPQSHKEMGEARILTTETVSNKKTNQNILPENYSFAFLANPNQCNMLAWSHLWKL